MEKSCVVCVSPTKAEREKEKTADRCVEMETRL
jgi:hypothetical protein